MRCTGVVLAGGRSARFGGAPKGLLRVHGERVVERVATALTGASDALLVVANHPDAARWLPGVPVVGDLHAGCGALGGVHAALTHAGTSVLVVAWDMPFVRASLLRALRDMGERAGALAVVPASRGPAGVEPLCAWLSYGALPIIERQLERGALEMAALHRALPSVHLPLHAVARHGDPATLFLNINTPHDLAHAERQPHGE